MTLFKPTLIVHRLLIIKNRLPVYDETFHFGLNVIRGQNSSGKTTIVKALIFGLGGNISTLSKELTACDHTIVETQINGEFATLKRNLDDSSRGGMEIFWGRYSESKGQNISAWESYPYSRSSTKESFSQALFRALEMPEVKGYQTAIVTAHQILRLIYGDQSTPCSEIFSSDTFDSNDTRQAVGDLLCGIYDDDLYNLKKERDINSKQLSIVISEIKSLFRIISKSESDLNHLNYDQEIIETQNQINLLREEILSVFSDDSGKYLTNSNIKKESKKEITEIEKQLSKLKRTLLGLTDEFESTIFEIADSEMFIRTLEHKTKCLDDAIRTKSLFESIKFEFCPSCHTPIANLQRKDNQCSLCGSTEELGSTKNHHKMRNDITNQIKESKNLLENRLNRKDEINIEIPNLKKKITALESKYRTKTLSVRTDREALIENLSTNIGSLERRLQNYIDQSKIFDEIRLLIQKRDQLQASVNLSDIQIKSKLDSLEEKRLRTSNIISNEVISILNNDLDRQDAFKNARSVTINFEKNKFSVDGIGVFSESSTVFAKNALLLGLMSASMKDEKMRFPRLLILDGIENGGMERERSYNFQNIIMKLSDNFTLDHQIIITTAEISPKIEGTTATVGKPYTVSNKSLSFTHSKK